MATLAQMLGNRKKNQDIGDVLYSALFGTKNKPAKRTTPAPVKTTSGVDESQVALLRSIAANARISAKNSMALPSILQQTNIMQKNIAKLVRIQGSTPTNKADAFFSNAKFREGAYEASYRKNLGGTAPTQQKTVEKKSIFDMFGSVIGIFKGLFNSDFLKKLLVGGVIVGGLIKYFKDPQFKKQVDEMLLAIREAFISDEGWKKLKSAATDLGLVLGGVVIAMVGLKLAIGAAIAYIQGLVFAAGARSVLGPGVPVPGPAGGKKGGFWRKAGDLAKTALRNPRASLGVAIAGGIGLDMMTGSDEPTPSASSVTPSPTDGSTPASSAPATPTQVPQSNNSSSSLSTFGKLFTAYTTFDLFAQAKNLSSRMMGGKMVPLRQVAHWKRTITKFMSKGWGERLLRRLPEKLAKSGAGKRVLKKVVLFVAGLFGVGPGWVVSLISGLWLIADALWVIGIIDDCFNEFEKEDLAGNQAVQASKNENVSNSEDKSFTDIAKDSFNQALGAAGRVLGGPLIAGMNLGQNAATMLSDGNAPPGAFKDVDFSQVKDKIIEGEGTAKLGNPYEAVFGYGKYGNPPKKLTDMTIAEVQAYQKQLIRNTKNKGIRGLGKNEGTGAVGAYQFTLDTLAKRAAEVYGPGWQSFKFTPEVQDNLARRNFDLAKSNNATLSKQWAYFSDLDKAASQLRAQGATGGSTTFRPQAATPPSTPSQPAVVPMRSATAIKPSGTNAPSYLFLDKSTNIVSPPAAGAAVVTPASMPRTYDSEQWQLLPYYMRNGVIGQ